MPRTHAEQVSWSDTVLPDRVRRPPVVPERGDRLLDDEVSFGRFVPQRSGRSSTPPRTYLRLMVAYLTELCLLARAITWIAVTGQRIHGIAATLRMRSAQGRDQAWAVVRRITAVLADLEGKVAADAEKVLVDARRALRRAVNNLTQLLDTTKRRAFRPTVKWRAWWIGSC